ncbi:YncE family protein [Corynebacterium sp. YIM 101645]|uniref:YncE family protein n=1 Tax=Corynebacterium lemuris TaxID=1859292 RepID=A0ABT2FXB6_9CORY|nr:YncE family protein [Corynebacterium lemuris]MCS5479649.1 YncE family protein [Corynebacterium lemuris]
MNITWKSRATQRAIAGLMSVAIATSGVAVMTAAPAVAQECSEFSTRNQGNGAGTLTLKEEKNYKSGDIITLVGTGFEKRPDKGSLAYKLNDGALRFEADQAGSDVAEVDGTGTAYVDDVAALPDAAGNFEARLKLPTFAADGQYGIRLLAGNDGGAGASKFVIFNVVNGEAQDGQCGTIAVDDDKDGEPGETSGAKATAAEPATAADGTVTVDLNLSGFSPEAAISATAGTGAAQWRNGRETAETIKAAADGTASGTLVIPAGAAPAGENTITLKSDKGDEVEAKITTEGALALSANSLNATATATVANLAAGAQVTKIAAGDTTFYTGTTTAGADGKAVVEGVKLAGDQSLVGEKFSVTYTVPGGTQTLTSGIAVTPDNSEVGAENFTIDRVDIGNGQYQTAVNPETGKVFAARAVGRPPIQDSGLIRLDGETLAVEQEIKPAAVNPDDESKGVYGVYGIGLDNKLGYVWVTNTRQNTIAVYKQSDLSLVKQFEAGEVAHSRDVVVDPKTNKAYVSSAARGDAGTSVIEVYDGKTLEKVETIQVKDPENDFGVTMSLAFDEKTGELFTTSFVNPTAAKIDVRNGNKITFYDLGDNVATASGVAWDSKNRNLYIANQGTSNVVVVDVDKDEVIADIPTGAGALNAVYDPVNELVYVANRGGGTATVIDAKTLKVTANLPAGVNANHISVGPDGSAYLVNKAGREEGDKRVDDLYRYRPIGKTGGENPGPGKPNPGKPSGSAKLGGSSH